MSIITGSASKIPIPIPTACFLCGEKIHKHGKRRRHVIEKGKKFGTPCRDYAVQPAGTRILCYGVTCYLISIMQPPRLKKYSGIRNALQPRHMNAERKKVLYKGGNENFLRN
jgi:hypothetical protein